MRRPRLRLAHSSTVVAVLAAGALGAGCGSGSSSSGNENADPAAVLPASSLATLSATLRPQGAELDGVLRVARELFKVNDPGAKIQALFDKGARKDQVTYAKNVKPWLGRRAAVALTSLHDLKHPDFVVAIASKDDGKAADVLTTGKEKLADRTYRGVKYKFDASGGFAGAVADHELLIGTEPGLKQAIDVVKGGAPALAADAAYKKAQGTVTSKALAFGFARVPALLAVAKQALGARAAEVDAITKLYGVQSLQSVALGLDTDGKVVHLDVGAAGGSAPAGPSGADALAAAPAGVLGAIAVGDFGGTVTRAITQLGKVGPALAQLGRQSLGGTSGTGLAERGSAQALKLLGDPAKLFDLIRARLGVDVGAALKWIGPTTLEVRGSSILDIGGALIIKSKDPAATVATIKQLRRVIRKAGTTAVAPLHVAGTTFAYSVRSKDGTGQEVDIALAGDRFVAALGNGALAEALHPPAPLSSDAGFKSAATAITGVRPSAFFDLGKIAGFVRLAGVANAVAAKAAPYLSSLSFLVAGGERSGDTSRERLALGLK